MSLTDLLATVPQPGRLSWIGLRTAHRGAIEVVDEVEAIAGLGLAGDRRTTRRPAKAGGKRQVSLIQAEHLDVVASLLGRAELDPVRLRRNLVVAGINLAALDKRRFRIGEVILEGAGPCHPCSRMEEEVALGVGGYQALRGHGGIVARIVSGGRLRVGDQVDLLPPGDGPLGTTAAEGVTATR
ncbi:MAG: MOSC domain-containing protein [Nitriliruptor sp.]